MHEGCGQVCFLHWIFETSQTSQTGHVSFHFQCDCCSCLSDKKEAKVLCVRWKRSIRLLPTTRCLASILGSIDAEDTYELGFLNQIAG